MNVVIIFPLPIIFNNFHLIYANTAYWGESYSYTHNSYKEAQAEGQRIVMPAWSTRKILSQTTVLKIKTARIQHSFCVEILYSVPLMSKENWIHWFNGHEDLTEFIYAETQGRKVLTLGSVKHDRARGLQNREELVPLLFPNSTSHCLTPISAGTESRPLFFVDSISKRRPRALSRQSLL